MARNINMRRRGSRVQVYESHYDPEKKRGVQKSLGSLDYYAAMNTSLDVDQAIERAASEKLEQALEPTEWRPVKEWIEVERDEAARRRTQAEVRYAPERLADLAAAFEAARDLESVELPNGEAAHAALDRLRRAMKRAGVHRPPKSEKTAQEPTQEPEDPNQINWLDDRVDTDPHSEGEIDGGTNGR